MTTGKLIPAAAKGAKPGSTVTLPVYNADTKEITHEGKTFAVPDGTKYEEDGQTFILHHERTIKGGWKRMRSVKKQDAAKTKK